MYSHGKGTDVKSWASRQHILLWAAASREVIDTLQVWPSRNAGRVEMEGRESWYDTCFSPYVTVEHKGHSVLRTPSLLHEDTCSDLHASPLWVESPRNAALHFSPAHTDVHQTPPRTKQPRTRVHCIREGTCIADLRKKLRQGSKISQQAHYGDLSADLMSSMFQCDTQIISFVSLFSRSYSIATRQLWQGTEKGTNRVQRSKLRFCAFYMHPAAVEHSLCAV